MNPLVPEIAGISELALQVMQAILSKNEKTEQLTEDGLGPLALASALSDFFMISDTLENGSNQLDSEQMAEFGDYGLDLLDRLASQIRQLEIMDQRENMARVYASLGTWLARHNAELTNLEGIADGFGWLVNGLSDSDDLAAICVSMDKVTEAASEKLALDEDRSNPWRPWRVLNLNTGIAATRSLDTQLMQRTFDKLGRRLPYDMPGFLVDGKRQMATQNIPDEVSELMDHYIKKWPTNPAH
jgi:hypothetical protein